MIEMPKVIECDAKMCAYNKEKRCRVLAINVGGSGPICEAFVKTTPKCAAKDIMAGVGACKVKECKFNGCLMCGASGINVQWDGSQAMCDTFKLR